jgi:hypothetical protein
MSTAELVLKAEEFSDGSPEAYRLQAALNLFNDQQLSLDGKLGEQTFKAAESFKAAHPQEMDIAAQRLDYQQELQHRDQLIAQNASADPDIVRQIQATANLLYPNYPLDVSGQADRATFSRLELIGVEAAQLDRGTLNDVQNTVLGSDNNIARLHVAQLALQADTLDQGSGRAFELQAGLNLYTNREIAVDGWPGQQTKALAQTFQKDNPPLIEIARNSQSPDEPGKAQSFHAEIPPPDQKPDVQVVELNN